MSESIIVSEAILSDRQKRIWADIKRNAKLTCVFFKFRQDCEWRRYECSGGKRDEKL